MRLLLFISQDIPATEERPSIDQVFCGSERRAQLVKKPFALLPSIQALVSSLKARSLEGPLKLLLDADSFMPEAASFLGQV